MSDVKFPGARFSRAGASKVERAQLEREFERSDLSIQQGMVDHFKSQSTAGLREYLGQLRDLGHFDDVIDAEIVETPQRGLEGAVGGSGFSTTGDTKNPGDDKGDADSPGSGSSESKE